ncbi:MAG: cell division protein ZapA [Endomicrobium sp.]|jgi:cell division protein ZapA (FtsZ GTPase activity inhibitor)|nr:cell division protein ZapA [Endomicrobium sp.]
MVTVRERIMGRYIDLNIEDLDELSFSRVVDFVNEQWMEVKIENVTVPDTQKIAVLTVVKIAVELLKLKDIKKNISGECDQKIKEIIMELDKTDC